MFDETIGGWTNESMNRELKLQEEAFKDLKKSLGDEFLEEVDKCRHNLILNTPQVVKCCKTCKNYVTFGRYANVGHCPITDGCLVLGIPVNEFCYCGKWDCLDELLKIQRSPVNHNFVAEALAVRKQNEEYERKRREAENSQKEDKRNV